MAERTDPIQQSIEEKRHDIEQTRMAMTEKLELLEERVRETVEGAKSTVEDIIENVKETVDETVGTVRETVGGAKSTVEEIVENVRDTMDETVSVVKRSFDLRHQVEQRPWFMFGSSIVVGYMLGNLGGRRHHGPRVSYARENESYVADTTSGTGLYSMTGGPSSDAHAPGYTHEAPGYAQRQYSQPYSAPPRRQSMWGGVGLGQFREEFDIVKGAVIAALMSNLRELIKQNMPSIAPQLERAINSATTKLGAQPIDGQEQPQRQQDTDQREAEHQPRPFNGPKSSGEQKFTSV